jgi:serine/threonine protein kinase
MLVNGEERDRDPAGPWPSIPGYVVLGVLGRGGMGVVYKARQISLNRSVALKMILAGAHASEADLARFRAEAEAVAQLQHPNVVQIYEVGEYEGRPFLSLEYVDGGSLAEAVAKGQWPVGSKEGDRRAAELVETLARAIHAAHRRNIVHRDLKPGNILLSGEWRVASGEQQDQPSFLATRHSPLATTPKITDFGLAKRLDAPRSQTRSGSVLGTPCYMAPEQAGGKLRTIGPATDVYALGTILYELLTGRPPFQADSDLDTLMKVASEEPQTPSRLRHGLPRDLEVICLKCLRKDPAQRFGSALELADELRRYLNGEPIRTRPLGRWERARHWARRRREYLLVLAGAATALVVVLALVGLGLFSSKKERDVTLEPARRVGPIVPGRPAGAGEAVHKKHVAHPPPPRAESLPDDLALVPPDALGFVSVRLADLLHTKPVELLQQQVAREMPAFAAEARGAFEKMKRFKKLGLTLADIERATLVYLRPGPIDSSVVVIVRTTRPYDADRLLPQGGKPVGQRRLRSGKKDHVARRVDDTMWLVSDRAFVIGTPGRRGAGALEHLLKRNAARRASAASTPMLAGLRLAAQTHHLTVGLNPPPPLLVLAGHFLPAQADKLRPLLALNGVTLSLDLETPLVRLFDPVRLSLTVIFPDEAKARAGQAAAEEGVRWLQTNLKRFVQAMLQETGADDLAAAIRFNAQLGSQLEYALRATTVRREGPTIHLPLRVDLDLPRQGTDLVRAVEEVQVMSRRVVCTNQFHQLALAMHTYAQDHGHLPPAVVCSKEGRPLYSWRVLLLPYLQQEKLYRQFNLNERWDSEQNRKLLTQMPAVFRHPLTADERTRTCYQVFDGPGAAFEGKKAFRLTDFPDGTANTLLLAEAAEAVPWTKPADLPYRPDGPLPKLGGHFKAGVCAAMADGSAIFVTHKVKAETLRAAITRNGNEKLPKDWNK